MPVSGPPTCCMTAPVTRPPRSIATKPASSNNAITSDFARERSRLRPASRERHDVHVAGRPLDGERQSGDLPALCGPLELVIVTAADCPHGAAGGVGEHV